MDKFVCSVCGKETETSYTINNSEEVFCKDCSQFKLIEKDILIGDMNFCTSLRVLGWLYFLLSVIGGIILWSSGFTSVFYPANSQYGYSDHYKTIVDYNFLGYGIVAMFQGLILLMVMIALARITERVRK